MHSKSYIVVRRFASVDTFCYRQGTGNRVAVSSSSNRILCYRHGTLSSAHCSPLLDYSPSRSIFGYSHPAPASRPAQIFTPPSLKASYTTFTETRSPLQNSFTPSVVGSAADMASPLPLQHANTVCYDGDFSSLPNHLVSDSILQRNPRA
jgi:hypothetical protein